MKRRNHSFEFKLEVVNAYFNDEGVCRSLSQQYHVHETLVKKWVNQYRTSGYQGLTKYLTKTQYTRDFKLFVLKYKEENQLSYRETAQYFRIKQDSTIANWHRKLRDGGYSALEGKIGRPRKQMTKEEKHDKQDKRINR